MDTKLNRQKLIAVLVAGLVTATIITSASWFLLRQPDNGDYAYARNTAIKELETSQEKLSPAVNTYLTSFKKAQQAGATTKQAEDKTKADFEAFKRAEQSSRDAIEKLVRTRAANDAEVSQAVMQLAAISTARVDYFASLVDSYPEYQTIFGGEDNKVCTDIFLGETSNLNERKDRLQKAAGNCHEALSVLAKSQNHTLRDYALKTEKRLKLLEQDAATVVETEKKYEQFLTKKAEYDRRLAEAEQRNATAAEYDKLTKEVEATNDQIKENQAVFDYSSTRYLKTVKEFPTLYGAVFSTDVPQKVKYFQSLTQVRLNTLHAVLDDKLLADT